MLMPVEGHDITQAVLAELMRSGEHAAYIRRMRLMHALPRPLGIGTRDRRLPRELKYLCLGDVSK